LNVLIARKEVAGIVFRFDLNETFKIVAVRGSYPLSTFVHHKIYVSAAETKWFKGGPVVSGPFGD
jgi:hypothetical protein